MTQPFDDNQLRAGYTPRKQRGPDCPSPEALLAAVRGEGAEAERLQVLDHALQCEACRPELALLHSVSEPGVARARQSGSTLWRRIIPLAIAASALLAVGIATVFRPSDETNVARGGTSDVVLRSPADGATVGNPVMFVWRQVDRALDYNLEVSDDDGNIQSILTTTDTLVVLSTPLSPGEYRWWVTAHLDDRSERRSETRVLRSR